MTSAKRPPEVTVVPRAATDVDAIIAKRLQGDPFAAGAVDIPLRDPEHWATYVASGDVSPNRHYEMVHKKGWVPLTVADLPDGITPQAIGWQVAEDGQTLCRGVRGNEVAYKMPLAARSQVQQAKTARNLAGTGSAAKVKASLTAAASGSLGDEAASFVDQNVTVTGGDRVGPLGG